MSVTAAGRSLIMTDLMGSSLKALEAGIEEDLRLLSRMSRSEDAEVARLRTTLQRHLQRKRSLLAAARAKLNGDWPSNAWA